MERTVKDVVPALQTNRDGVRQSQLCCSAMSNLPLKILKVISSLAEQYKTKEQELENFKRDYNIRVVSRA